MPSQRSSDMMRLTVQEASDLSMYALGRIGYTDAESRIITDHLVDAAMCGSRFSGLPKILLIAEQMKNQRDPIEIVHETSLSAMIDGGHNVAYLPCFDAMKIAIEKAKAHGIALVGVHNSYFSGRNSYYLEKIALEGLVGIHTVKSLPRVAPPGGASPALGTNPIAFGFPGESHPVIIDMGTAAIMYGEVRRRERMGAELPMGTAIDSAGEPTLDPKQALLGSLLTWGGHKGFGISLAVQLMGLLAGGFGLQGNDSHYGFLFIAIDPAIMMPREEFRRRVSEMIASIKAIQRIPGVEEIRIPSERAFKERERSRTEGIHLERQVYNALSSF